MSITQDFIPSCPSGGNWFSCGYGSFFVGCCDSDNACNESGCASTDLRSASFNRPAYGTFEDQLCANESGLWYTCTFAGTLLNPFMGCCAINPCANKGCPSGSLIAGKLNIANDTGFKPTALPTGAGPTSSATGTPAASSSTHDSTPTAAIAGGAAGGAAGLIAILALIFFFWRRSKKAQKARSEEIENNKPRESRPFLPDEAMFMATHPNDPKSSPSQGSEFPQTPQSQYPPYRTSISKYAPSVGTPGSPPPSYPHANSPYFQSFHESYPQELPVPVPEMSGLNIYQESPHANPRLNELDGVTRVELDHSDAQTKDTARDSRTP